MSCPFLFCQRLYAGNYAPRSSSSETLPGNLYTHTVFNKSLYVLGETKATSLFSSILFFMQDGKVREAGQWGSCFSSSWPSGGAFAQDSPVREAFFPSVFCRLMQKHGRGRMGMPLSCTVARNGFNTRH